MKVPMRYSLVFMEVEKVDIRCGSNDIIQLDLTVLYSEIRILTSVLGRQHFVKFWNFYVKMGSFKCSLKVQSFPKRKQHISMTKFNCLTLFEETVPVDSEHHIKTINTLSEKCRLIDCWSRHLHFTWVVTADGEDSRLSGLVNGRLVTDYTLRCSSAVQVDR
jgi:hypothetical protein